MKEKILIISGIVCLLLLVLTPMVTADNNYSKENGPYQVLMLGKNIYHEMPSLPIWFDKMHGWQIGPICHWHYPFGIGYIMVQPTLFRVNGLTEYLDMTHPNYIYLAGFRGYAPGNIISGVKEALPAAGGIRVFGVCDEIDISNGS